MICVTEIHIDMSKKMINNLTKKVENCPCAFYEDDNLTFMKGVSIVSILWSQ